MDDAQLAEWLDRKRDFIASNYCIDNHRNYPSVRFTYYCTASTETSAEMEVTITPRDIYFSAEEDESYTVSFSLANLQHITMMCSEIQSQFMWVKEPRSG